MRARSTILGFGILTILLTAGAAQSLSGSNTVFSDDIVDNNVRTADLGTNSVTRVKVADNAIAGPEIIDNAITGTDISESTIPGFKKVFISRVSGGGIQLGGDATSATRVVEGTYDVTFPFSLTPCATNATPSDFADSPNEAFPNDSFATVDVAANTPMKAKVRTRTDSAGLTDASFSLVVVCP